MIDQETYERARKAWKQAIQMGRDPIEVLDYTGLLLTKDARQSIRIGVLMALHGRMNDWSPAEYLFERNRVGPHTPQDMFEAIDTFVARYIQYLQEHPE